jgi:hypothetical protein
MAKTLRLLIEVVMQRRLEVVSNEYFQKLAVPFRGFGRVPCGVLAPSAHDHSAYTLSTRFQLGPDTTQRLNAYWRELG